MIYLLIFVGFHPQYKARAAEVQKELSSNAQLSILTVGPSKALFTTFGHTAIRISDPQQKIDAVYNFGTFDRDTEWFLVKFLKGTLRYHLSRQAFRRFKQIQQNRERRIRELVLDLSASKIRDIHLELEKKSASSFSYEYRFFSRNCVTLVRDLLERHDILQRSNLSVPADIPTTYRGLMNDYLPHKPWLSFGVNLILGKQIDQPLASWNQINLPRFFHYGLTSYQTKDGRSLVANIHAIYTPPNSSGPSTPVLPVYVTAILAVIVIALTIYDNQKRRGKTILYLLLFGLPGIVGVFMLWLHMWSYRPPLHYNLHLFWMVPGLLVPMRAISFNDWQKWKSSILTFILAGHLTAYTSVFFGIQQWPRAILPIAAAQLIGILYFWFKSIINSTKPEEKGNASTQ